VDVKSSSNGNGDLKQINRCAFTFDKKTSSSSCWCSLWLLHAIAAPESQQSHWMTPIR